MIIEFFSGHAGFARACGRLGFCVLMWDTSLRDHYDLSLARNRSLVLGCLRRGLILGWHAGVPCNTLTRARDRGPGPPPVRSDLHVLGLPGLSPKLQMQVDVSNTLNSFVAHLSRLSISLRIPFSVENPRTSRLWLVPVFKRLLRRRSVSFVVTSMCQWGTQWRKDTSLLLSDLDASVFQDTRCTGASRGLCSRTGPPPSAVVW